MIWTQLSVGYSSSIPSILKSFHVIWICPMCAPPSGQLETVCGCIWWTQFKKILACWIGSNIHMCNWGWAYVFIKRLFEVTSSSSSRSVIFPDISCWLMLPFLHTEYCGFSYLSQPCTYATGWASRAKLWEGREKQTELGPTPL